MSYGIKIFGPDNENIVFSNSIRTSNIQLLESRTLETYNSVETLDCKDAQDDSKILITFKSTPVGRNDGFELYYTRLTDQIRVQVRYTRNNGVVPSTQQNRSFGFTLMAIRIK